MDQLEPAADTPEPALYLIKVWRGVSPEVSGPFETADERAEAARSISEDQEPESVLFWADVSGDGQLAVGAYSEDFLRSET